MLRLRGILLFQLCLVGGGRRSMRINDSRQAAQQHNNMVANGFEVSAEVRGELIPGGFGTSVFHRAGQRRNKDTHMALHGTLRYGGSKTKARIPKDAIVMKAAIIPEDAIAPSILSSDFARLGEDVQAVLDAGASVVHFDVMDNHYVPNLTIGPMVCKALKDYGITAPIDVHLMVSPVDRIIEDFAAAGADYVTFHPEATGHIDRSLSLVRSLGMKSGLVFNPSTSLDVLKYVMDKVDIILLMSVNPGFGGQKFIPGTLDKLREARKLIDQSGYDIRLEIDGGVTVDNIKEIKAAGADMFVAGSAIFGSDDYKATIDTMKAEIASVSTNDDGDSSSGSS